MSFVCLQTGGYVQNTLQKVEVVIYNDTVCSQGFSGRLNIFHHVCAGWPENGRGSCQVFTKFSTWKKKKHSCSPSNRAILVDLWWRTKASKLGLSRSVLQATAVSVTPLTPRCLQGSPRTSVSYRSKPGKLVWPLITWITLQRLVCRMFCCWLQCL